MQPYVTIAVQCHNFQRRLNWMLSSLLPDRDAVVVRVDAMADNGTPRTADVVRLHRQQGLNVDLRLWDDYSAFERRGIVRNEQVISCGTQYICFADSDMVYEPMLWTRIWERALLPYDAMLIAGRYSQPPEDVPLTNAMVDARQYPCIVHCPWDAASALPKLAKSCVGAGFFQLVPTALCGGYYVKADECRDRRWSKRGQKAKSDQQFRRRIGRTVRTPRWVWEGQIHLNHDRDNMVGYHLETQR